VHPFKRRSSGRYIDIADTVGYAPAMLQAAGVQTAGAADGIGRVVVGQHEVTF
jgi:hypothetical protein